MRSGVDSIDRNDPVVERLPIDEALVGERAVGQLCSDLAELALGVVGPEDLVAFSVIGGLPLEFDLLVVRLGAQARGLGRNRSRGGRNDGRCRAATGGVARDDLVKIGRPILKALVAEVSFLKPTCNRAKFSLLVQGSQNLVGIGPFDFVPSQFDLLAARNGDNSSGGGRRGQWGCGDDLGGVALSGRVGGGDGIHIEFAVFQPVVLVLVLVEILPDRFEGTLCGTGSMNTITHRILHGRPGQFGGLVERNALQVLRRAWGRHGSGGDLRRIRAGRVSMAGLDNEVASNAVRQSFDFTIGNPFGLPDCSVRSTGLVGLFDRIVGGPIDGVPNQSNAAIAGGGGQIRGSFRGGRSLGFRFGSAGCLRRVV